MKILLALSSVLLLSACGSPAAVVFPGVLLVGTAVNVHESGDEVESLDEAKDRIVSDVREGYREGGSFDLNE